MLSCVVLASAALAASEPHLISDATLRTRIEAQIGRQRALAARRDQALFGVLKDTIAAEEREALQYLFAFMPLSDLADYDGAYYLRIVRATLEARRAMPWGKAIPEDVFLRYVLPHRVNTENLDDARPVLFAELKDRVTGLGMADAVLEVNHWCHEHVTYKPSDARTSSPLATIRTSWGRCGEESTLVVAALRALGIPARQVYTPRWAHQDDNHAWVEAWVDGAWRYVGACEPEPALDMAWFREPARRAMMVHTKVMGGSPGPEDRVRSTPWFDEINVLSTYAPTVTRTVTAVDGAGRPVEGAVVAFGLYNYAEFYPLATKRTGRDGAASLVSGKGDLRIWAVKGDAVGSRKLSPADHEASVVLGPVDRTERTEDLDLVPPAEPLPEPVPVSRAAREKNERRLAEEDRLRTAYMATFMGEAASTALAGELGVAPTTIRPITEKSQGNWREIAAFLRGVPPERRPWAVALLGTLSDKDLRDATAPVLRDHLDGALANGAARAATDHDDFVSYVLAPRVANEMLRPWRGYLQRAFERRFLAAVRRDPRRAVAWVRKNVRIDEDANYYGVPLSPRGVHELRVADPSSRDILFVALCRTAGVPARLEPATSRPQFRTDGAWKTVTWDDRPPAPAPSGRLSLVAKQDAPPEYSVHFALARLESGRYETLDFEGKPWSFFERAFELPAGDYVLTSGQRTADGTVLARQRFFTLRAGDTRELSLELRKPEGGPPVLGRVDPAGGLRRLDGGGALDPLTLADGKGVVLAWVGRGDEPSSHALSDLVRLKEPFEKWGGGLVLVLTNGASLPEAPLASRIVAALDPDGAFLARVLQALGRPATFRLPVILGVDPDGQVIFFSEGYSIGSGEQVLGTIRRLQR